MAVEGLTVNCIYICNEADRIILQRMERRMQLNRDRLIRYGTSQHECYCALCVIPFKDMRIEDYLKAACLLVKLHSSDDSVIAAI